ncbi:MAG TPA: Tol-Pal system beta propeller repeat protein TolB, partial [Elusimicrobia bacterium]|nr:Tol-Pal system beta propeller repeat protein TolB [Elusimicrobiota bacterium]
LATKQTRRLSNLNWCDAPAWSPTGEWIAFSGRAHHKDKMDIFLVDVTGSQIRQLTRGEGSNEDPAWSPDGRLLAFSSTREGRSQIFMMDADGGAPRKAAEVPGASSTPHWAGVRP